jgi:hypothetical protein
MKVLLVYENIPECTDFFVITDPTEDDLVMLTDAHGKVLNVDDENDGLAFVNNATCDPKYAEPGKPEAAKWHDSKITVEQLLSAGPFDQVFWSGFSL